MNKVVLDADLRKKLQDLSEPLEFCDESGRTLGIFSPVAGGKASLYGGLEVPVTAEEAKELLKQPRGRPLADITQNEGEMFR